VSLGRVNLTSLSISLFLHLATGLYSVAVIDDVPEYNPGTRGKP